MKLKYRIKMAWWILAGRESFDIYTEGYHPLQELMPGHKCDFCNNEGKKCYTRTLASFRLIREDHRHLCDTCGEKTIGKLVSEREILLAILGSIIFWVLIVLVILAIFR